MPPNLGLSDLEKDDEAGIRLYPRGVFLKADAVNLGAARLELAETEVDGFTVHCNCHYATPPRGKKICWRKDLNPQPSDYKSGALPIELLQQKSNRYTK